jgi:hypothetical protein
MGVKPKPQEALPESKITVSENGNYQCRFGKGQLHAWLIERARAKGCESIPELIRQLAQEAYERSNQQPHGQQPQQA